MKISTLSFNTFNNCKNTPRKCTEPSFFSMVKIPGQFDEKRRENRVGQYSSFSSLLTKLTASKQEAKQANGGQNHSDTFKLYINPGAAVSVGNSSTSALQVRSSLTKTFTEDRLAIGNRTKSGQTGIVDRTQRTTTGRSQSQSSSFESLLVLLD